MTSRMTTREALILPEGVTAKEWDGEGARVVTLTQRWLHAGPWCDERLGGTEQCADCAPDGRWVYEGVEE